MNILNVLYTIIISPLEMLIETVFCFELNKVSAFGAAGAIAAVSLAVSFLTLPIYNAADAIQQRERDTAARLAHWVLHIKQHFSGDERFMMLSYYYKQNNYHPLYALRSSLSIMIEVPFFIAAYHFLSHCPALQGASCGLLRDLGEPDGLIAISAGGGRSLTFNVLPILMTAINAASSAVYLKGFTLREKAQTYCLAVIFLILLYNSPSGLVLYWTLNNLFSLCKNAVLRWMKEPWRVAHGCVAAGMAAGTICRMLQPAMSRTREKCVAALVLIAIFAVAPYIKRFAPFIRKKRAAFPVMPSTHSKRGIPSAAVMYAFPLFLTSACGLALLCGLVLPASVIATSPLEFSFIGDVASPLYYVWRSLCVFSGLFVLWPLAIYKMMGERVKRAMPYLAAFALAVALLDVYVFSFKYGNMDAFLDLDNSDVLRVHTPFYTLLPLVAALFCAVLLIAVRKRGVRYVQGAAIGVCIAECALGAVRVQHIRASYNKFAVQNSTQNSTIESEAQLPKVYHLSKTGKNVVVLFLDRAINSFFSYIVRQFPQLQSQFDGFVYYPNTVSFSNSTSKASPAMMGGYEYTPEAMNKRKDELLMNKHNEAMLVAPRLFSEAGWDVTVTDPPYSNYEWISDLAPFAAYPDIKCDNVQMHYTWLYLKKMRAEGTLAPENSGASSWQVTAAHIAAFAVVQAALPFMRNTLYNGGRYFRVQYQSGLPFEDRCPCINQFAHIYYLGNLTDCDAAHSTYTFICNDLTHEPTILKDGAPYDGAQEAIESGSGTASHGSLASGAVTGNGEASGSGDSEYCKWRMAQGDAENDDDIAHYNVNAAAMEQIARWLGKLRELGVYDNTRIIIVSDHGWAIRTPVFDNMRAKLGYTWYNPLLLVKDFDAHGSVRTDNTFMTNADTILLAVQGLPISGINPFTGKSLTKQADKREVRMYPIITRKDFTELNVTTQLKLRKTWILDEGGMAVHDNIFDERNWRRLE